MTFFNFKDGESPEVEGFHYKGTKMDGVAGSCSWEFSLNKNLKFKKKIPFEEKDTPQTVTVVKKRLFVKPSMPCNHQKNLTIFVFCIMRVFLNGRPGTFQSHYLQFAKM